MSYVPNTKKDQQELLTAIGLSSLEELFRDIPSASRLIAPLQLPPPLSELELERELALGSTRNKSDNSFLGAGCYKHFIPSVVKHIISRSEFYTAYTPYQAEMSQGTLQTIFEYQTMVCELTGMDIANASMYDGATALAEAALLACRQTRRKEIVVDEGLHPEYLKVLKTYADAGGFDTSAFGGHSATGQASPCRPTDKTACLIIQQPNFFGNIIETSAACENIHKQGGLFIVCVPDIVSLGVLKAPGQYGADIAVGEGRSLGTPMSFGGPALGIFAAKKELLRQVPGRIVGQTTDKDGKRGFCLTMQTREQHIRREKAGSNICSNEALCALAACVYLSAMGKQGLRKVAELCLQKAHYLADKIELVDPDKPFFREFVVKTDKPVGLDLSRYYPDRKGQRLICVSELHTKKDLDRLAKL
ncbi:MAG: aminomethyl-transferring glycine dehydrogenase subunit GcvPA [Candidatus Margulisbacteria bacterium]|nr:aminomethyl-transferring glycine dehydrogenase subunit GcvPA [Candidatus Margulisiibacteriota bacterium]